MDYPDFDYLSKLALKAGKIIVECFGSNAADWKEDRTPVTTADISINTMVVESISHDFPHISIIAEEGSCKIENAEYSIFCDPLDGTFPFLWDIPIVSFCIAVVKNNIPLIGIIYDPFLRRMWYAFRGKGAFLNRKPLKVSQLNCLGRSAICMIWWKGAKYNLHQVCLKLMDEGANWFNPVSVAYPGGLLAMGKIDAIIFPGQKGWETAAMQVIAEEAGGKVTDIFGNKMVYSPDGEISGHIISNSLIHQEVVALVKSCQ